MYKSNDGRGRWREPAKMVSMNQNESDLDRRERLLERMNEKRVREALENKMMNAAVSWLNEGGDVVYLK